MGIAILEPLQWRVPDGARMGCLIQSNLFPNSAGIPAELPLAVYGHLI